MAANTRFAVAIHAAAVLAMNADGYVTSESIASSVNTNPVVIRRILRALTQAGLVESQIGKSGGSRLARPPERITLLDIFKAVEFDGLFGLPDKPENKRCHVSCGMKQILTDVFEDSQKSVESRLKRTTLAQLVKPLN